MLMPWGGPRVFIVAVAVAVAVSDLLFELFCFPDCCECGKLERQPHVSQPP
jgi:hypothetical protein